MPSKLFIRRALAVTAALAVAAAATVAAMLGPAVARAHSSPTVAMRNTEAGRILVTGNGHTLYAFARDGRNRDRCAAISGCTSVWPVLTVHGRPTAGAGVRRGLLSTISLPGGRHQVTYAGHPLYGYASDDSPGDTDYVGVSQFGGTWFALRASGALVK